MRDFTLLAVIVALVLAHLIVLVFGDEECQGDLASKIPHLSDKLIPDHYYLEITVDLDADKFNGKVTILVFNNPDAATDIYSDLSNYIILHASPKLRITTNDTKVRSGGEDIAIKGQCRCTDKELWIIEMTKSLSMGQHFIDLVFEGDIENTEFNGLYKISYSDVEEAQENVTSYKGDLNFAMTIFYLTSARKVFPCLDEPRFKTEFSLKIRHQEGYRALCHVEAVSAEKEHDGWIVTTCHSSGIKTPTFLVGFNINPFTSSTNEVDGIVHRVWSPQKFAKARRYALSISPKVLKFYHEFTGLSYPNIGKLDLVAIPSTKIAQVGIEDWGLVSIREDYLLWKGDESTLEAKIELARLIAHELSHQWFANRVSIKYFRDEWLNEGFAQWMQYKGVDAVEPSWNNLVERMTQVTLNAYFWDAKNDSLPVVPNVEWYEKPTTTVGILYNKAAAILYMIEEHMGKKWFKKGVQKYMKEHDGGVVVTEDLWKALQSVIDKKKKDREKLDVKEFYNVWVTEPGFPLVVVNRRDKYVIIEQQRFVLSGKPNGAVWPIHVTYYKNGKKEYATLTRTTMTIRDIGKDVPLKFNVEHQGFYITWYNPWSQLSPAIASSFFKPIDYAGLIIDITLLTSCGKVPYEEVIPLVSEILNATNDVVTWKQSLAMVLSVDKYLKTSPNTRQALAGLVQSWVERWYGKDMWTEKKRSVPQIGFAVVVIKLACHYGHRRCLEDAKRMFDGWRHQNAKLTPNLRALVLRFGLKESSDVEDLNFVWRKYEESQDTPLAAKKSELKTALSYVTNDALANRYLDLVLNKLTGDTFYDFVANIAKNPDAVQSAWTKFSTDFDRIRNNAGLSADKLGELLMLFASQFSTSAETTTIASLLLGLYEVRKALGEVRKVEQTIEINQRMQQRLGNAFTRWEN